MLGRPVRDFVPEEVRREGGNRLAQIFQDGRIPPFETKCLRKDGVIRDLEVSATPIQIEGETHVIYFVRDITEQKLAADALRTSEERFRQLAENIREIFGSPSPTAPQSMSARRSRKSGASRPRSTTTIPAS
jgi:PAS domain-containing protein